ncbi:MAG TPA: immunoglobulin domain-containing protein [Kiritimatiellia bacterium]|nr:immunoglobulin domain-containing protein [Kiritimatiellia bacterium]HPS09018.1 immunoglobulin domain-containing protein [Kiritimatiellia bacterium]
MHVSARYLRAGLAALCAGWIQSAGAAENFAPVWSAYVGFDYDIDTVNAVVADSATNSYFGGFLGDYDRAIHNSMGPEFSGNANGFVAKTSPTGVLVWATDFYDEANYTYENVNDEVRGLAVSSQNRLAVVGVTQLPDVYADEGTYAFVASLDADTGAVDWFQKIGNAFGTNSFNAVAVGTNGDVYAVGHTSLAGQTCNVPGYQVGGVTYGTELKGATDALVVKFTADGTIVWRHYLGGVNADSAAACAVTPDGSVYVAGETRSPGWTSLPSGAPDPANSAGFIVKLTAGGAHVWSSFLNGGADDAVNALRADAATASLFVGGVTASTNFLASAARLNAHAGGTDGFIVKLTDTNTAFRTDWCRFAGGAVADDVAALALLSDGRLAAGGTTGSGAWLTQTEGGAYHGGTDGFVTILNATNGAVSWSAYVGGANADDVAALAAAADALFTAGSTYSPDWIGGGFWDTWTKDSDFDETVDFVNPFGFVAQWGPGAPVPPAITSQPSALTVREGASATFGVTATGTLPLSYRWFRNGAPLAGLSSNSYTVGAASYADNGAVYSCTVSNVAGTATSSNAVLTVIAMGALKVTISPAEAVAQGAKWSLDNGAAWLADGLCTNLPGGTYAVSFSNLAGWLAPAALPAVQVAHAATNALAAAYTPILAEAGRTVAGTNVTLTVRAPAGLTGWTLVETLDPGLLAPTNISGGGVWNGAARTLTFAGSGAATNTFSYSACGATSGVYTVVGAVTSQPANIPMVVTGDTQLLNARLIRAISGGSVTITMLEPTTKKSWYVNEFLPTNLVPETITGPGSWISDESMIYWGIYGTGQTLTYEVTGAPGSYTLSGIVSIAGVVEPIFGDSVVTIPGAEIPPPDILSLIPVPGTGTCALTFTSVVNQAYAVLTNGVPAASNGWATCLAPVTGAAGATQCEVPAVGPRLFYRVRVAE